MSHADYADSGIGIAAGSDRPAHHSDAFYVLRNLTDAEAARVQDRFGVIEADYPRNKLRFNQVLHLMKQRSGPTLEQGIPLRYTLGLARYTELAYQCNSAGAVMIDANGYKIASEELAFLHSREFQRRTNIKPGKVPQPKPMAA